MGVEGSANSFSRRSEIAHFGGAWTRPAMPIVGDKLIGNIVILPSVENFGWIAARSENRRKRHRDPSKPLILLHWSRGTPSPIVAGPAPKHTSRAGRSAGRPARIS